MSLFPARQTAATIRSHVGSIRSHVGRHVTTRITAKRVITVVSPGPQGDLTATSHWITVLGEPTVGTGYLNDDSPDVWTANVPSLRQLW